MGSEPSTGRSSDAPAGQSVPVVLVDQLPVVRAGLRLLIDAAEDLEVVGEAGDSRSALTVLARLRRRRAVLLVGLGVLADRDRIDLIGEVRERYPTLVIVALGADADIGSISMALFAGVDGFIDKNSEPSRFLDAIRSASHGDMVLAGVAPGAVGKIAATIDRRRRSELLLTQRERDVLAVAAEGLTARQIAERLGVRERTITTHLDRIYDKLGVSSRFAAIRAATRSGLVTVAGPE